MSLQTHTQKLSNVLWKCITFVYGVTKYVHKKKLFCGLSAINIKETQKSQKYVARNPDKWTNRPKYIILKTFESKAPSNWTASGNNLWTVHSKRNKLRANLVCTTQKAVSHDIRSAHAFAVAQKATWLVFAMGAA